MRSLYYNLRLSAANHFSRDFLILFFLGFCCTFLLEDMILAEIQKDASNLTLSYRMLYKGPSRCVQTQEQASEEFSLVQ